MKKYVNESIILILQLFMFYIFPLFAGPTDAMGMVILIMLSVFVLGIAMGVFSKHKLAWLHCVIVSILFIPSIPIYYNWTAWIHSIWYLAIAFVGEVIGFVINWFIGAK